MKSIFYEPVRKVVQTFCAYVFSAVNQYFNNIHFRDNTIIRKCARTTLCAQIPTINEITMWIVGGW